MIALDPNEKYKYVFSTDREKPVDQQPALIFHFPTCREVRQIANLFDEAEKAPWNLQNLLGFKTDRAVKLGLANRHELCCMGLTAHPRPNTRRRLLA